MIFTLSVVGVVRMLLWIIGLYVLIKILSRIFAPILLKFAAKKMEKRFGEQFGSYQKPPKQEYKEGETVIDKVPNGHSTSNKTVGEYIDYEEID